MLCIRLLSELYIVANLICLPYLVADSDSGNDGEGGGNLMNYKGIYFNDDPNSKFTDPETGAHFAFKDMCARLNHVLKWRR